MDLVNAWNELSYFDGILFTIWLGILYIGKKKIDKWLDQAYSNGQRKSYILVDLWWYRRIIVAECLECEHEWVVERLAEDCPECSSPNVLYLNCDEASTGDFCGS